MREILFKAKRVDNGEWVEGLLTVMWGQYHIINPQNENIAYPIDTETISQYTGMTINEYQKAALRTVNKSGKELVINCALGLSGESGEVADLIKKWQFQGHRLNQDKVIEEIGDVAWYVAVMAAALNVDLETVLQANVDKLKKRYPEGFDQERSINRNE